MEYIAQTLHPARQPETYQQESSVLTDAAWLAIWSQEIPDLTEFCQALHYKTLERPGHTSALDFTRAFTGIQLENTVIEKLKTRPSQSYVLVDNDKLKVSLILWKPGKISSIHGHPKGGCLFKVLHGSLIETRYSTDAIPQVQSIAKLDEKDLGYIDDGLGFHAVGNPFDEMAVSIHAYAKR